jgi:hypothetical protein
LFSPFSALRLKIFLLHEMELDDLGGIDAW